MGRGVMTVPALHFPLVASVLMSKTGLFLPLSFLSRRKVAASEQADESSGFEVKAFC